MENPAVYFPASGQGLGSSESFSISRPLEGTRHAIPSIICITIEHMIIRQKENSL